MALKLVSYCATRLGLSTQAVRRIANSAHHRYKHFKIAKRRKGEFRDVAQPSREVKALQRCIVELLTPLLPIHESATAYKPGASILSNAKQHLASKFLLKLDFVKFFDSLKSSDIQALVSAVPEISPSPAELLLLSNAVCWSGLGRDLRTLCIGAPSSPFFSNCLMYAFDAKMATAAKINGTIYTRYSDDITISGMSRDSVLGMEDAATATLNSLPFPRLEFRSDKRVLVSASHHLSVTGLTLATQGHVTVGRCRKRGIRAGLHKYKLGKLSTEEIQSLRGEIAFAQSIECDFMNLLFEWDKELMKRLLLEKWATQS